MIPVPEILRSNLVNLSPLSAGDFEPLYLAASDPLIWEQHPATNRFERDIFKVYFDQAMQSGSAFTIRETVTGEVMGSTRFYDFDKAASAVCIGYTFIARKFWGGNYNFAIKKLMLDYAFQYVETVHFHIGESNIRSQKAIAKINAIKVGEKMMHFGREIPHNNFIFAINRVQWQQVSNQPG